MIIGPEVSESIELRFSNLARKMNAEGRSIISLGLGEPDFPTPSMIVDAAVDAMRNGDTRYSNPFGLPELRQRIAAKLKTENGIAAEPDQIVVTPGAKMALSLALGSLLQPGDEIIALSPCYPSYVPQIRIAEPGCTIHRLDLSRADFSIDFDLLAGRIGPQTKAVLLNFPNNPTGKMLAEEEIEILAEILGNTGCWLFSDEVYERLNFSDTTHLSPGAHEALANRTITINGFSKAYSMTGWRIGYVHVPDPGLLGLISKLQQHLNTNTATFIQRAAYASFDVSNDFLESYNAQLAANHRTLSDAVKQNNRLRLVDSQGGLFAFLDLSALDLNSDKFATQLLESQDVAATPGIVFGEEWGDHLRISLAIDTPTFTTGIERLDNFARCL